MIEGLASWTLDEALDPESRDTPAVASRCGVIATSAVAFRTTLLIARFRYHLRGGGAGVGRGAGGFYRGTGGSGAASKRVVDCPDVNSYAPSGATEQYWIRPICE